ncbi:DUF3038 domain-containing protein [Chamaesiphon sp. OTE_20_metabat_361]|uniref:DUF3038 domain-containing protein n=1 Tax=Chamaesiphon sp. OTE_20_metabat_361 TaxID=2964689 RepID=UPI00286C92B0|nr:DUF3038 domain-containing protein [Chamaesiphon sp. OTE_20_metabat_361]
MPASTPKLDDLFLTSKLDSSQLERITAELDVLVIAIAALTPLDRVRMQQVAHDLQLELLASEWINAWSVEQQRVSLQLNIQQVRAVVLMVNELARTHQDPIRRNLAHWQQTIHDDRLPLQSPALANYLDNFITIYQARANSGDAYESFELLSVTALNLLVGLLFYSSSNGHQRLWAALLKRSH